KMGIRSPGTWCILGSRAVGGAALVMTEASAVEARGRISAVDAGIYLDAHTESWRPIAEFIKQQGAVAGMQLAHAGRKASTAAPWTGGKPILRSAGGWERGGAGAGGKADPQFGGRLEAGSAERVAIRYRL